MIAGIGIGAIIATVLAYQNRESINALWDALKKIVQKTPLDELPAAATEHKVEAIHSTVVNKVEIVEEPAAKIVRAKPQCPYEVKEHVRNLSEGWHASDNKRALAKEHGFELGSGQTWVESYIKNDSVA